MDMYELEPSNMAIEAWTYDKFKENALTSSLILIAALAHLQRKY